MTIERKRSRILTLDLLRGYFLFVIIVDHARFFPSFFELVTGRGEMWASAAEGFFIISGLLVGYVYGPRMVKSVLDTTKRIWQRALLLYVLSMLLTLLFVWWGNLSGAGHVKEGLWMQPHLGEFLYKTLTMQYYYGWADFLPYYAIFMAWAPLALYAIVSGRGWMVLGVSGLCWLMRGGSFEMSWQLLFMGSMVAGWYLPKIEAWARALNPRLQGQVRGVLYGVALALVVVSVLTIRVGEVMVHEYAGFASLPMVLQGAFLWLDHARDIMTPLIVKWTLEPVRLVTALIWFAALYVWMRQHEATVDRVSRGLFKTLGERSLVVYVVHAVVIFALLIVVPGDHGFWLNNIMTAAAVALVFGLTQGYAMLNRYFKRTVSVGLRYVQLRRNEESV